MDTGKLVESMSFEQVVMWANLLGVKVAPEEVGWSDDKYPDEEDALRVALVNMIDVKLAEQLEAGVPKLLVADKLRLRILMCEELIELLYDDDTQISITELLYEKFFEGHCSSENVVENEAYEKLVSECCTDHYKMYRRKIKKFLCEML